MELARGGDQHRVHRVGRDGVLHAWGRNQYGNLGIGSVDTVAHATAVVVPELAPVVTVACGRDHVLALQNDGAVHAWGLNASNQVDASDNNVTSPVAVVDAAVAVYANGNQGFYEDGAGRLFGWGQNGSGNLGIPSDEDQPRPSVAVFGLENVVDVAIGALHGVALDADGFLFAWGWSFQGSLGGGSSTINLWPYRIPILVEGVR